MNRFVEGAIEPDACAWISHLSTSIVEICDVVHALTNAVFLKSSSQHQTLNPAPGGCPTYRQLLLRLTVLVCTA